MSTCRAVAWYELVAFRRDGRVAGAIACLLLLVGIALVSGARGEREYERVRARAQAEAQEQWLTQGEKNPHSAAHFGVYAFRPVGALSLLEPGVHAFEGISVYLEAHAANDLRDAPAEDASSLSRLGGISAAMLLRTVLPLILFALAAPLMAGERERGTLKLLIAQGVPLRTILWGKAMALGALVAITLAAASLCAVAFAALFDLPLDAARAGWLLLGYALYAFVALAIGLSVSTWAATSRAAWVALLGVWIVFVVAAPRVATYVTELGAPLPLAGSVRAELDRELDHDGYNRRTDELRAQLFARHGVTREDQLPMDFRGISLQVDEERGYPIFDRHRAKLREGLAAQDAWLDRSSLAVPWLALERWSAALAGTDRRHVEHFSDAAETHRRDMVGRMNTYLAEHKGQTTAGRDLWETVPAFRYQPPDAPFALAYAWPALLVLFGWCLFAVALSELALRRHKAVEAS